MFSSSVVFSICFHPFSRPQGLTDMVHQAHDLGKNVRWHRLPRNNLAFKRRFPRSSAVASICPLLLLTAIRGDPWKYRRLVPNYPHNCCFSHILQGESDSVPCQCTCKADTYSTSFDSLDLSQAYSYSVITSERSVDFSVICQSRIL